MKPEELVCDPVCQLNLLLWMAKEQPATKYRVRPFFYEQGFSIMYVQQAFAFPQTTATAIAACKMAIAASPQPELILVRMRDKKALYVEAKANSFSSTSSNCRQARGHLLAAGPAFAEVYGPVLDSCLLCYLLPESKRGLMAVCLSELSSGLSSMNNAELAPGPFSVHGLAASGACLVYCWDAPFKRHIGIDEDSITIIEDLEDDTDPMPLLLVFSDEDCSDPQMRNLYRRALIDQIRAILLCELHSWDVGNTYETTLDSLLDRTTGDIRQFLALKRQNALRRLLRANVFRKIQEYWNGKQAVAFDGNHLTITWNTPGERDDFVEWLEDHRRAKFDDAKPPDETPGLFETQ